KSISRSAATPISTYWGWSVLSSLSRRTVASTDPFLSRVVPLVRGGVGRPHLRPRLPNRESRNEHRSGDMPYRWSGNGVSRPPSASTTARQVRVRAREHSARHHVEVELPRAPRQGVDGVVVDVCAQREGRLAS